MSLVVQPSTSTATPAQPIAAAAPAIMPSSTNSGNTAELTAHSANKVAVNTVIEGAITNTGSGNVNVNNTNNMQPEPSLTSFLSKCFWGAVGGAVAIGAVAFSQRYKITNIG